MKSCKMGQTARVPSLTVHEAREYAHAEYIDVRRADEFVGSLGHIDGARLFTLETEFEDALKNWPKDKTYIFVCRSGARSTRATELAIASGFKSAFNMEGGMLAWNAAAYPVISGA